MARPLKHDTGPVCIVEIDDRRIGWCDGEFFGDEELIEYALRAAITRKPIELQRCNLISGVHNPLEAVAAMSSYCPGRTLIITAPAEVSAYIKENQFYV